MYGRKHIVAGKQQETQPPPKAQNKGTINREGKHEERERERERDGGGAIVEFLLLFLAARVVGARV